MKKPWSLGPAQPTDLADLALALARLPLMEAYGQTAEQLLAGLRRGLAADEGLWVARDQAGRAQGVAWFTERGGLGLAGYLRLLAVLPAAAGQGVGAQLLTAFERVTQAARGGQLALCNATNAQALAFYARHSYREVGRLPGFVHPAHCEVLLHKGRAQKPAVQV